MYVRVFVCTSVFISLGRAPWCSGQLLVLLGPTVEISICVCKKVLLLVTGASVTFVCDPVISVSCSKHLDSLMPGEGASYSVLS